MDPMPHIAQFVMKIGGSAVPPGVMDALLECTIENSLHLPDVCTLRIHDAGFHWLDSEVFAEGKKMEILGGMERQASLRLFCGEVVAQELDLNAHGVPTLLVRCYDRSHRLHRGRYSRTFEQVTDADVVKKVGQEAGFVVHADSTPQVHDWLLQNNQSNWEFLMECAERNGFRLYVQGDRDLYFKKVTNKGDRSVTLEWGLELRSFRPRVSAASQVDEVVVRGWNPKTKQSIVGKAKKASGVPQVAEKRSGAEIANKAFGNAKMMVTDKPVHSQKEADELARSICDSIGSSYLTAEGLCYGRPDIIPGTEVEIKNIGKRFSGKYHVTGATHTYTSNEGFSTLFSVSGKQASTLLSLMEGNGRGGNQRSEVGGNIVVAVVTDNKDPDGMGRVKVKYPWLTEDHASFWARTASQMAGKGRGMFNLPEINDEVLVAFEHGDVRRPYTIGMLWNGKDAMPATKSKSNQNPVLGPGSVVNRRGFTTRIGHTMDFDDTGGKGKIMLKTAGGHEVNIDDAGKMIEIKTTGGHSITAHDLKKEIVVKTTGGHTITASDMQKKVHIKTTAALQMNMNDAAGMITIMDNAGDVMTMSHGMINIKASQMMNLNAPVVNIAGMIAVNITGLNTSMVAGALATVSGQVMTTVSSGSVVNVTGSMLVDVKGGIIKLN